MTDSKRRIGTIDLTPTWRAIVPILVAAIENGTPTGRKMAVEELYRMADIIDAANRKPAPLGPDENIGSLT